MQSWNGIIIDQPPNPSSDIDLLHQPNKHDSQDLRKKVPKKEKDILIRDIFCYDPMLCVISNRYADVRFLLIRDIFCYSWCVYKF